MLKSFLSVPKKFFSGIFYCTENQSYGRSTVSGVCLSKIIFRVMVDQSELECLCDINHFYSDSEALFDLGSISTASESEVTTIKKFKWRNNHEYPLNHL